MSHSLQIILQKPGLQHFYFVSMLRCKLVYKVLNSYVSLEVLKATEKESF